MQFLSDSRLLCMTRWQAFRTSAWHGAKIGFVTFTLIMALVAAGVHIMAMLVPQIRAEVWKDLALETLTLLRILKGAGGGVLFLVGFGILYGAIPGALIMGVIAAVRWRCSSKPMEPPTPVP